MNKVFARLPVAIAAVTASAMSQAAAVDVTTVTADIAAQSAPIAAIGAAVLILLVGIKAFKWVRRAM
jgi:uncharacterized membrane protein